MRAARITLAALGVAVMAYAIAGAAADRDIMPVRQIGFLLTVLAVHDGLLLPAFIGIGVLIHRYVPASMRAALQGALIASAALTLIAIPLILGYGRLPDNPSALPRDYPVGLAIVLATVWFTAGLVFLVGRIRSRR